MNWVSVLAVFLVAHMVGDYLFQTDWQARNKRGGLSGGVALPHLVIDDGRIVRAYLAHVKRAPEFDFSLAASVDQSFHILSLCLVALLLGAA